MVNNHKVTNLQDYRVTFLYSLFTFFCCWLTVYQLSVIGYSLIYYIIGLNSAD